MKVSEFQFNLPEASIAQTPVSPRDASRLLVLDRQSCTLHHKHFSDLPEYLRPGDLLVLNDTKVIPARLQAVKPSGGIIEVMLLEPVLNSGTRIDSGQEWSALLRGFGKKIVGATHTFPGDISVQVLRRASEEPGLSDQIWIVRVWGDGTVDELLEKNGQTPIPPYIRRGPGHSLLEEDRERYQTVYASPPGAVAAPTAGLHFTESLLQRIRGQGVNVAALTLHVGWGTFQPVRVSNVEDHVVAAERCEVGFPLVRLHESTRQSGNRVIAVGTTVARALEHHTDEAGRLQPGKTRCDLVIRPPFRFKALDALVTNFHLPGSSLLFLVAALAGKEKVLRAYREAIDSGYRFYSYGDAMLIQ